MPIPDYQTLMLPVLQIAAEGDVRMPDVAEQVAAKFTLSDEDVTEMLPSGRQPLFYNRLAWAKFYMSKAGLIESPTRGTFRATAAGRTLLEGRPKEINNTILKKYPAFLAFSQRTTGQSETESAAVAASDSIATPEEQIDAAKDVLQAALRADVLERLIEGSPAFFERVVIDLLVAMGYGGSHEDANRRVGKSGDGGIDGIIDEDRLGLNRIYVQAKKYSDAPISRPALQAFVGSLVGLGATKGVFFTTSRFSSHATDYVSNLQQRIVLIDGERLAELMIEHGVGVRVSRTITINRMDEDFFVLE